MMEANPAKKTVWKKQIPTLLGLGVLILALVVGIIFLPQGLGVFAPRATPQTTPKLIKVTNATDSSFTISFLTDEATAAFIKSGTESTALKSQIGDDRDQLSGTVAKYQLHHLTVRGLSANTNYFYTLGTASNAIFDDNGQPFKIKTGQRSGAPSAAKTAYGTVLDKAGAGAGGAVIYVKINGVGEMSTLVKTSGSWALPLSNARNEDGSGYAEVNDSDQLEILVQGESEALNSQVSLAVSAAQPVGNITLGENSVAVTEKAATTPVASASPVATASPIATASSSAGFAGSLSSLTSSPSAQAVLNLEATKSAQVLNTGAPLIKGSAAPNVSVSITVNSTTAITQTLVADASGKFELDIAKLQKELEPGEHTVTYSYTDPTTGELVSKTVNFTVESQQLALATGAPYSSSNPYSMTSTSSASKGATASATATRSAKVATTSSLPKSGAVETTLALVLGGIFFIIAGGWSYFLALQYREE